jgi:transposase-like protein
LDYYKIFLFAVIGKYNRGKHVNGSWIFGGVERETGRCFLVVVPDRSEATLLALIKQWILPGTIIYSDCWKSYHNIQ